MSYIGEIRSNLGCNPLLSKSKKYLKCKMLKVKHKCL